MEVNQTQMLKNEFINIIESIKKDCDTLLIQKNKDYATEDFLSNFKRMFELCKILNINTSNSPADCALFLTMLKIDRICNLKRKRVSPENESVKDTVVDLHNYVDLLYGCLVEKPEYCTVGTITEKEFKNLHVGKFIDNTKDPLINPKGIRQMKESDAIGSPPKPNSGQYKPYTSKF